MSLEHTNPSMKNCLMPQIPSGRWFYFNSCCDKKGTDSNGFSPLGDTLRLCWDVLAEGWAGKLVAHLPGTWTIFVSHAPSSHSLPYPRPRSPPQTYRGHCTYLENKTLGSSLFSLIRGVTRISVLPASRPAACPAWEDGDEGEGAERQDLPSLGSRRTH